MPRLPMALVVFWAFVCACERLRSTPDSPAPSASAALPSASISPAPSALPTESAIASEERFRAPLPVRERDEPAKAKRYAALGKAACQAELAARKLPVKPARGKSAGIETPLQLTGPLRGIRFLLPRTVYGFMDCRLVLLLDDLAEELARSGVSTIVVNNTYRPRAVVAASERGGAHPSQHALGLAVDITEFRLQDGLVLNVERHWHGARGTPPCGPESRVVPMTVESMKLRDLACTIGRGAYCNHLVTPNRDEAHFNHLHCDIEAGANEIMVD